jgi:hypothetical protein
MVLCVNIVYGNRLCYSIKENKNYTERENACTLETKVSVLILLRDSV